MFPKYPQVNPITSYKNPMKSCPQRLAQAAVGEAELLQLDAHQLGQSSTARQVSAGEIQHL